MFSRDGTARNNVALHFVPLTSLRSDESLFICLIIFISACFNVANENRAHSYPVFSFSRMCFAAAWSRDGTARNNVALHFVPLTPTAWETNPICIFCLLVSGLASGQFGKLPFCSAAAIIFFQQSLAEKIYIHNNAGISTNAMFSLSAVKITDQLIRRRPKVRN